MSVAIGPLVVSTPTIRPLANVDPGQRAVLADVEVTRVPLDDGLGRRPAVELAVHRGQQAVRRELRDDRERLVDRQLARRHAERVLESERRLEPLDVGLVVEEEQVAVLPEVDAVHPLQSVERPQRDLHVQRVGELRAKASGGLARRA